jgi:hypothetical protein
MAITREHVDLVDGEVLAALITERAGPCLTITMPTERMGAATQKNPIRFKNAMTEAEETMGASEVDSRTAGALLEAMHRLVGGDNAGTDYWQTVAEGLALFAAPGFAQAYRLPEPLPQMVTWGTHFHIRHTLPQVLGAERFYLLALDQQVSTLYVADRFRLREVDLGDVPRGMEDMWPYDDSEPHQQVHTAGGDAFYHSQATASDDSVRNDRLLGLMQALENGVTGHLQSLAGQPPLILAGGATLRGLYRPVNRYPLLLEEAVALDPQALDIADLHQAAWAIMAPGIDAGRQRVLERYHAMAGRGDAQAVADLVGIVRAAAFQRVDTLLISRDAEAKWGRLDIGAQRVVYHEDYQPGDDDLLNTAVVHTLRNGGSVQALAHADVPGSDGIAAILRY